MKQSQFYSISIENASNSHKALFSICKNLLDLKKSLNLYHLILVHML